MDLEPSWKSIQARLTEADPVGAFSHEALILYWEGKPVGLMRLRIHRGLNVAVEDGIYLVLEHRGQTFARALMDEAIAYLRSEQIGELHLGEMNRPVGLDRVTQNMVSGMVRDYVEAVIRIWRDVVDKEKPVLAVHFQADRMKPPLRPWAEWEVEDLASEGFWENPELAVKPAEMEHQLFKSHEPLQEAVRTLGLKVTDSGEKLSIGEPFAEALDFRAYEIMLALHAVARDTVVILPTGLGKTMVALLVVGSLLQREASNPDFKIVLTAPSNVLRQQHRDLFIRFLPHAEVVQITSDDPPARRRELWEKGRVILATNEMIAQSRTPLPVEEADYLMVDEAHLVAGDHASTKVIRRFRSGKPKPQGSFLGLTATPDLPERIPNWLKRLGIPERGILATTEQDPWIQPYVYPRFIQRHLLSWNEGPRLALAMISQLLLLENEYDMWDSKAGLKELKEQIRSEGEEASREKWEEWYNRLVKARSILSIPRNFERLSEKHLPTLSFIDDGIYLIGLSLEQDVEIKEEDLIRGEVRLRHPPGRLSDRRLMRSMGMLKEYRSLLADGRYQELLNAHEGFLGELLVGWIRRKLRGSIGELFFSLEEDRPGQIQQMLPFGDPSRQARRMRPEEIEELFEKFKLKQALAREDHDWAAYWHWSDRIRKVLYLQYLIYLKRALERHGPIRLAEAIDDLVEEIKEEQAKARAEAQLQGGTQVKRRSDEWQDRAMAMLKSSHIIRYAHWLRDHRMEGPKTEFLLEHLRRGVSQPHYRTIDFVNDRKVAARDEALIRDRWWGIKAELLIGQSKGGMTQQQQVEVVERFRQGKFPILVATQVAEMGLGIPDVNELFLRDVSVDHRSRTQRMGRTSRSSPGIVHMLIAKGTSEQYDYWKTEYQHRQSEGWILLHQRGGASYKELPVGGLTAQSALLSLPGPPALGAGLEETGLQWEVLRERMPPWLKVMTGLGEFAQMVAAVQEVRAANQPMAVLFKEELVEGGSVAEKRVELAGLEETLRSLLLWPEQVQLRLDLLQERSALEEVGYRVIQILSEPGSQPLPLPASAVLWAAYQAGASQQDLFVDAAVYRAGLESVTVPEFHSRLADLSA